MAIVRQAVGTAVSASTGTLSPAWPTHQADDVALLFVTSSGNGTTESLDTANGFKLIGTQTTGTGTGDTKLSVYWARATSSSMAAPVLTAGAAFKYGVIITFRGVKTTGAPYTDAVGGTKATASTTATLKAAMSPIDGSMIVLGISSDVDSASAWVTSMTNAALTSLTEQFDAGTITSNGGGIGIYTGTKTTGGDTGTTSASITSSKNAFFTIALQPPPVARYWVGGSGSWTDTAHWSTTSGGAGGASEPTVQNAAIFDANSFSANGQTVTFGAGLGSGDFTKYVESIDFSAITYNVNFLWNTDDPTASPYPFAVLGVLNSFVLSNKLTVTLSNGWVTSKLYLPYNGVTTINMNGCTTWSSIDANSGAADHHVDISLASDITVQFIRTEGSFHTNNYNVSINDNSTNALQLSGFTTGRVDDFGTSTIEILNNGAVDLGSGSHTITASGATFIFRNASSSFTASQTTGAVVIGTIELHYDLPDSSFRFWTGNTITNLSVYGTDLDSGVLEVQDGMTLTLTNINVHGDDYSSTVTPSYTPTSTTFSMHTLTGGATSHTLGDEAVTSLLTLPFTFPFFGTNRTSYRISSNGFIHLIDNTSTWRPDPLPQAGYGPIAGIGMDLDPSAGGTIKSETFGTTPNRVHVVEFADVKDYGTALLNTFQIKLFEATGVVEIHVLKINHSSGTVPYRALQPDAGDFAVVFTGDDAIATGMTNNAVKYTQDTTVTSHPNLLTIQPHGGTSMTFSAASGTKTLQYVNLLNGTFTGGATWLAYNSVDRGGNTGIKFMPETNMMEMF